MHERYTRSELIAVGVQILAEIHSGEIALQQEIDAGGNPTNVFKIAESIASLRRELSYVEEFLESTRPRRTPKKRKRK